MSIERLTAREREVLERVSHGMGMREIGASLGISPETARKHRDNAVRRMGTGSQVTAALEFDRGKRSTAPA